MSTHAESFHRKVLREEPLASLRDESLRGILHSEHDVLAGLFQSSKAPSSGYCTKLIQLAPFLSSCQCQVGTHDDILLELLGKSQSQPKFALIGGYKTYFFKDSSIKPVEIWSSNQFSEVSLNVWPAALYSVEVVHALMNVGSSNLKDGSFIPPLRELVSSKQSLIELGAGSGLTSWLLLQLNVFKRCLLTDGESLELLEFNKALQSHSEGENNVQVEMLNWDRGSFRDFKNILSRVHTLLVSVTC
jgi:Lysine methyltransferase